MARRMLIDASHPEETRVVVVDGTRLEEFDFETATRKPLKGNIYLAKVFRIDPSLQAACVEYAANRHGFLAFSEIHPDYYQIPVADRERLIAEQQRLHAEADDDEPRRRDRIDRTDIEEVREDNRAESPIDAPSSEPPAEVAAEAIANAEDAGDRPVTDQPTPESLPPAIIAEPEPQAQPAAIASERLEGPAETVESAEPPPIATPAETADVAPPAEQPASVYAEAAAETPVEAPDDGGRGTSADPADAPQPEVTVETLGGDDVIEQRETRERRRRNPIRQYKIQEVIKRRQILLVQVVKEERGNKGAALTTYLSLAGRYCVLMPNTSHGGGISRKISNGADRKRLKSIMSDLNLPKTMGLIVRTAGLSRTKTEIKRDFDYLARLWDEIRERTLGSTAPALIYGDSDLIKRAIRDLYHREIDEVVVSGEDGYREAKDFMRMLMPSHSKLVQPYRDPQPLFAKFGVESQLDAMFSNVVTLKSGGYLVINPTEALVSIDVNSGRSTREHNIEDTALRTNLEAAEEIARQLRLRDLAGLIVIDFIDMEERRNNRSVEKKLSECLKNDRARIQLGRISVFGLLEMSRQRIRTGVLESSSVPCSHCAGTGSVRAVPSVALHILRAVEETLLKSAAHNLVVRTRAEVALYILNQKRTHLRELETRFGVVVTISADETLGGASTFAVDRGEPAVKLEPKTPAAGVQIDAIVPVDEPEEDEAVEVEDEEEAVQAEEAGADGNGRRRRRRRRRGRGGEGRDWEVQAGANGLDSEEPDADGLDADEG